MSIFLNSFSQCRINTYIYIVLWIFHRLEESTWICHCIKMVQIREMTIILCTLTHYLKGVLTRISYILLPFTNKLKKIQNLPSNQYLIISQQKIFYSPLNFLLKATVIQYISRERKSFGRNKMYKNLKI